jgi:hypothetical protein
VVSAVRAARPAAAAAASHKRAESVLRACRAFGPRGRGAAAEVRRAFLAFTSGGASRWCGVGSCCGGAAIVGVAPPGTVGQLTWMVAVVDALVFQGLVVW